MKQIVLKSMSLLNFKGIKNLHIELDNHTDVFGANGTGKTTLADAFTWCLFGKDSFDRKDFEIKTIDALTNKVIPEIDHEVTLVLLVNNSEISVKRVLKEKWSKKRGSETAEFTGNVNELYWDGVPVNLSEFNKKVAEIVNELVFKMVTSTTYFM
jgi:DNA repair exonuclease SbcCD ATPase subunit